MYDVPDCTVFLSGIFNAAGINRRVNRGVNRRSGLLIFSRDVKKLFRVSSLNPEPRRAVLRAADSQPTPARRKHHCHVVSGPPPPPPPPPLPPHCHGCCVCRADAPLRCLCYRCCGNRLQRRVKDSAAATPKRGVTPAKRSPWKCRLDGVNRMRRRRRQDEPIPPPPPLCRYRRQSHRCRAAPSPRPPRPPPPSNLKKQEASTSACCF